MINYTRNILKFLIITLRGIMKILGKKLILTVLLCSFATHTIAMQPPIIVAPSAAAVPNVSTGSWFAWIPALIGVLWTGWEAKKAYSRHRKYNDTLNQNNHDKMWLKDLMITAVASKKIDGLDTNGDKVRTYGTLETSIDRYNRSLGQLKTGTDATKERDVISHEEITEKLIKKAQSKRKKIDGMNAVITSSKRMNWVRPLGAAVVTGATVMLTKNLESPQTALEYEEACKHVPNFKGAVPTVGSYKLAKARYLAPLALNQYTIGGTVSYVKIYRDVNKVDAACVHVEPQPFVSKKQAFDDWLKRYEKADLFNDTTKEYCPAR